MMMMTVVKEHQNLNRKEKDNDDNEKEDHNKPLKTPITARGLIIRN